MLHGRTVIGGLLLLAVASSACATGTGGGVTPAPFPSLNRAALTSTPSASAASVPEAAVQTALSLRGTRYRLGGLNPKTGLDCSGLVAFVFGQLSLPVPRTVGQQFEYGQPVDFNLIQAGDLLFFATTKAGLETGSATHVGIAVGPPALGEFVHAPGSGDAVRVDRFDAPYWRARWVGARRVY